MTSHCKARLVSKTTAYQEKNFFKIVFDEKILQEMILAESKFQWKKWIKV